MGIENIILSMHFNVIRILSMLKPKFMMSLGDNSAVGPGFPPGLQAARYIGLLKLSSVSFKSKYKYFRKIYGGVLVGKNTTKTNQSFGSA